MANNHDKSEFENAKYVGDSRIRANRPEQHPLDYSQYPGKTELFFPDFLLREWMVAVVVLVGFMSLVLANPAPLGNEADPTNTTFVPLPDWYFLFLYQLLKYDWSSGVLTPIGTVIIPGVAFGALFLAPWLDKGESRRPSKRPVTMGTMLLAIVAVVFLTWSAADEHHMNELAQGGAQGGGEEQAVPIVNEDSEANDFFQSQSCVSCHASDLSGASGPPLLGVGDQYNQDELHDIIANGTDGGMPPFAGQLSDEEIGMLAEWLAQQKAEGGEGTEGAEGE